MNQILLSEMGGFETAVRLCREVGLGLEYVRFTRPAVLDDPHQDVYTVNRTSDGIPFKTMHGPFSDLNPVSVDERITAVVRQRFNQALQIAGQVGARGIVFHSGFIPKTYPMQHWQEQLVVFWKAMLAHVPARMEVYLENVYEDDFDQLQSVVEALQPEPGDLQSAQVGICLDIGHANANSHLRVPDWIAGLNGCIRHVHLHNNWGALDDHNRLNEGSLDIAAVLEDLQQYSPGANWVIEASDLPGSIQVLKDLGYL